MKSLTRWAITALAFCLAFAATNASPALADPAGKVHFVKRTGPEFDHYMNQATPQFKQWMNAKFWRSEVYTPYFDNKTSWYANGWVYEDSYSIYHSQADSVPADWFMRDAEGRRLFIPWGCSNGTCPQYAADFTNPAYRAWWITQTKAAVAKGYKGVWVDDVNFDLRAGDGDGNDVRPIDRRTGRAMTDDAWRDAMATFMEELRAALPASVEILHNSIWYAGGSERDRGPHVRRQIAAADFINLERGVNDDGLTGGDGEWSLRAVLDYVDRVHAAGTDVIFDAFDDSPQGREYNLAAYLLVSSGNDGVGLTAATPENWWSAWDLDLGEACGPRTLQNGVLRREFTGGTVLVNEPGAPVRTVALAHPMVDTAGRTVSSVALPARGGAVLSGAGACAAGSLPVAPAAPTSTTPIVKPGLVPAAALPSADTQVQPTPRPVVPTGAPRSATKPAPAATAKRRVVITRISSSRGVRSSGRTSSTTVRGRVTGTPARTVALVVHRRVRGRWVTLRRTAAKVRSGGFSGEARGLPPGSYRMTVVGGSASARSLFAVRA